MINGVEGLSKIDENYTVDKAIVNINRPNVCSKTEHSTTTVRNPNWPEASQLAIYKCS